MRVMACFIPKDPGQQVGAGHVDLAVWLVVHCCRWARGSKVDGREDEVEAVIKQG
jgi:hypothetical protein